MTRRAKPENDIHGAPEPTAKATEQADPSPVGSADDAAAIIARLEADNAALKDRLLRALAETENVRRRAERELNDARQYAVAKFAGDMLGVADNIERAIANVPAQVREGDDAVRTLIEGVELTEKELLRSLERHGVRKLDPLGERFDPNFHEALFEVPDPSVPSGTVSKVIGAGYSIGTRSLRPARVGVSSGGPRQPAEPGAGRQP
jgi:molecular chaperone GrpE